MATRRYGTIVRHLTEDPETAVELTRKLSDDVLNHVAAAISDEIRRRAIEVGDPDAVIAEAFETAFGRDGLGTVPWIEKPYIVCPGAMVMKNQRNHTCRFVSVDDTWIWNSFHLLQEDKRSSPGPKGGFRAVALLPITEKLELDVVTGKQRGGQHQVDHVVSYVVKRGKLVEVSQRTIKAPNSH